MPQTDDPNRSARRGAGPSPAMLLTLSSFTYGWAVGVPGHEPVQPLDEHGLIDRCHAHGVRVLQIGDNLPWHLFPDARLDRLADRAAAEGIQLELGARRLDPAHLARCVARARRLRARLLRFVIDGDGHHPDFAEVRALLRDAVPGLEGVVLGLENHDRWPARLLRALVESAGSDRVGICLDTANSLGAGEGLATVLAELGPLAVNLHVKDLAIERLPHQMGFTVTGRPAGSGMLDLPSLLATIAAHGRCTTVTLELWTPPGPTLADTLAREEEWAGRSVHFLQPLLARVNAPARAAAALPA